MAAAASALLVTQHYLPEPTGSGPVCAELAASMVERTLDLTVLTNRPFYPEGRVSAPYRKGLRDSERIGGIRVERVEPWLGLGRSAIGRMATDIAFLVRGTCAVLAGRVRRSNLVISVSPSVLTVFLGWALTHGRGRHVVIVHDIESGMASGLGMVSSNAVVKGLRAVERAALNRADAILALSPHMKERLVELGITTPVHVVPLWVDTGRILPLAESPGLPKTILYSGNLGRKQGLEQLIDVATELRPFADEVRFVIRGDGGERSALERAAATRRLDNIAFEKLLPAHRLNEGLAQGHVHLVPQNPEAADFAVPSKAYAILAAGRPFVATARPGSPLSDMAAECGAFVCVPPYDTDAFADAVLRLARDDRLRRTLGGLGRQFVEQRYSKEAVTRQFLHHLQGSVV